MSNYRDNQGFYHDKPSTGQPSSNNGFYYTAIGLILDAPDCYDYDYRIASYCATKRIRQTGSPPISRDEVLGLVVLGYYKELNIKNWNFSPYPLPKFNLVRFTYQLFLLIQHHKDRNYFWRNNLDQMYRIAFSVPLSDRHFILKRTYQKSNLFYWIIHKIESKIRYKKKSPRLLNWFKTGNDPQAVINYFDEQHPFRKAINDRL